MTWNNSKRACNVNKSGSYADIPGHYQLLKLRTPLTAPGHWCWKFPRAQCGRACSAARRTCLRLLEVESCRVVTIARGMAARTEHSKHGASLPPKYNRLVTFRVGKSSVDSSQQCSQHLRFDVSLLYEGLKHTRNNCLVEHTKTASQTIDTQSYANQIRVQESVKYVDRARHAKRVEKLQWGKWLVADTSVCGRTTHGAQTTTYTGKDNWALTEQVGNVLVLLGTESPDFSSTSTPETGITSKNEK